jgi:hypothetical protein
MGPTALMLASQNGHLNAVKYLLSKGANPNLRAGFWQNQTAASSARHAGHQHIQQYLNEVSRVQPSTSLLPFLIINNPGKFLALSILLAIAIGYYRAAPSSKTNVDLVPAAPFIPKNASVFGPYETTANETIASDKNLTLK